MWFISLARTALAYRGVSAYHRAGGFPGNGSQEEHAVKTQRSAHSSDRFAPPCPVPSNSEMQAAAEILNSGKKIAILAGQSICTPAMNSNKSRSCWALQLLKRY